jgi:hypothetical protein
MSDIDSDLKRLFDDRLAAMVPPPRTARPRWRRGIGPTAAIVTLTLVGTALALDVNSVAASSGADCASFLTKVQVWAQVHRSDLPWTDHTAGRAELAKMVAASGCSPHDSTHDRTHPVTGTHH